MDGDPGRSTQRLRADEGTASIKLQTNNRSRDSKACIVESAWYLTLGKAYATGMRCGWATRFTERKAAANS